MTVREELNKPDVHHRPAQRDVSENSIERRKGPNLPDVDPTSSARWKACRSTQKQQIAIAEKRRQDLLGEEALLGQQINADQSRWSDVNSQLGRAQIAVAAQAVTLRADLNRRAQPGGTDGRAEAPEQGDAATGSPRPKN